MKRKYKNSPSSSHINSEGAGKYYKIDDKESNINKLNKEWSSGNYMKAFTHLILPLQNMVTPPKLLTQFFLKKIQIKNKK